jgi:hypothetical protein
MAYKTTNLFKCLIDLDRSHDFIVFVGLFRFSMLFAFHRKRSLKVGQEIRQLVTAAETENENKMSFNSFKMSIKMAVET